MIDWRQGGWTGSLNKWAHREVLSLLRNNETARRSRYPLSHRLLRRFFSTRKLGHYIIAYLPIAVFLPLLEVALTLLPFQLLTEWIAGPDPPVGVLDVSGYLLGAQVGILGVVSLALALITLIAQRESSSTDIKVYYYESAAFEIVASCIALVGVLCLQLLWPLHALIDAAQLGNNLQVSKVALLYVHALWLVINLCGLAHFVFTTLGFVQQSQRERLRELYTANAVVPHDLFRLLRQQVLAAAAVESVPIRSESTSVEPVVTFGIDFGEGSVESSSAFQRPTKLHDVRMTWLYWVLHRWLARSATKGKEAPPAVNGPRQPGPMICFPLQIDEPLRGMVGWCRRRGGAPLSKPEKLLLRLAFRFKSVADEPDLPRPRHILEELADKTAAQIDRLAPVAFDRAFREMTTYHRFLLALHMSVTPEGHVVNYSEVEGNSWHPPHEEWIRQYRRLFELAADRIPSESHFIQSLARTPTVLLSGSAGTDLSPNIVKGVLDLGPIMMHGLEAWVSKRAVIETPIGEAASRRLALAGFEAKAYANVLVNVIGAWEHLLLDVPMLYRWRDREENADALCWSALQKSWPFLWRHISNTAYCLALAVWSEDEAGAADFRDALVRWPEALGRRLEDRGWPPQRALLYPDLLKLEWPQASAGAALVGCRPDAFFTFDHLFAAIVRGAHYDAALLTAALLLSWTIDGKQGSNIGARTAKALLRRESTDELVRADSSDGLNLLQLFIAGLRIELSGERFLNEGYGADLDELVSDLDNMTERRVLLWRGFTPSTVHERHDLQLAMVVILAAAAQQEGVRGGQQIADLIQNQKVFEEEPLRAGVVDVLDAWKTILDAAPPQLTRGLDLLSADGAADGISRAREIVIAAQTAIAPKADPSNHA